MESSEASSIFSSVHTIQRRRRHFKSGQATATKRSHVNGGSGADPGGGHGGPMPPPSGLSPRETRRFVRA